MWKNIPASSKLQGDVLRRASLAMLGKINPWQLPEYKPIVQGMRTANERNVEDLASGMAKTGISGPAAALTLENAQTQGDNNVLNTTNEMYGNLKGMEDMGSGVAENEMGRLMQAVLAKQQIKSNEKIAKKEQQTGAFPNIKCCFIFLEGDSLTEDVRRMRDELFPEGCDVEIGYRRMAKWLVPVMRYEPLTFLIVLFTMLIPIRLLAENYYGGNRYGWIFKPIGYFWKWVWKSLGETADEAYRVCGQRL